MFKGYKLKFEFNAAHSNIGNNREDAHFHTFTLVLYLHDLDTSIDYFNNIEKNINDWLAPYQDTYLFETDLFEGKSTTLESIGEAFYDSWKQKLIELNFDLVRLDIFENPIRTYSFSDRILDADVNELSTLPNAFYETVEYKPQPVVAEAIDVKPDEKEVVKKEEKQPEEKTDTVAASKSVYSNSAGVGKNILFTLACYGVAAVLAYIIMYVLYGYGNYPAGSDTYCHLYRADVILQNLRAGNWYPLYDPYWYNGVEIMRYWGPLPLYVLAFSQWIAGNMFTGYVGYIGVLFILGAIGFVNFGRRLDRVWLGLFVGCIWFFLPENMKVIFYDGNMPRALINALLPLMICFIYDFINRKNARSVFKLTFLFALITFCHIGTTIMLIVVLFLYLLIYGKVNRDYKTMGQVLLCVGSGMLISGIWMVPSLHGSGAGGSNNQVMEGFFQDIFLSINPMPAWNGQTLFYFGLSLFVLCVLGLVLGSKDTMPGFAVGLIIFFLTSESAYDILSKLPFSSYLWMMRFVSLALVFVMTALLLWKGLKKNFVALLCLILLLDCVPTVRYLHSGEANTTTVEEKNELRGETLLFNEAKEITDQRMTVFDLSGYGAFAPYYAAGVDRKVLYMFGAGWEGARTAENIVMLNTAVETGCYDYVFDRCIEMGTDTLVFVVDNLEGKEKDVAVLEEAGAHFGYELVAQTEETVLMHKETPEYYGVITKYPYLTIGNAADELALLYPAFEEGKSDNLDDYTYDELAGYDIIYLSDFTYSDKAVAEALLNRLAEQGTKIYIDMNKVPVNKKTNLPEILGVTVQTITYHDSFPAISYGGDSYKTSGFPDIYKEWKANYLIGLDEITGHGNVNGKDLAFSGTKGNDNIVFLGYNFAYYTELTKDTRARELLSEVLGITEDEYPVRELVEIEVRYAADRIVINSPADNVNTTLADISDIFGTNTAYDNKHHMITVDKGTTVITIGYPYLVSGTAVSVLGVIMLVGIMIFFHRRNGYQTKKEC